MCKRTVIIAGLLLPVFFLMQCREPVPLSSESWYQTLRPTIQAQANLQADTKHFEYLADRCIGFEGILFKNKFYGPSTWWYCNGQMRQQGYRYANREIGIWRRWDENGVLVDSIDRGNHDLLDSLRHISVL